MSIFFFLYSLSVVSRWSISVFLLLVSSTLIALPLSFFPFIFFSCCSFSFALLFRSQFPSVLFLLLLHFSPTLFLFRPVPLLSFSTSSCFPSSLPLSCSSVALFFLQLSLYFRFFFSLELLLLSFSWLPFSLFLLDFSSDSCLV